MEKPELEALQKKVDLVKIPWFEELHRVRGLPKDFRPWRLSLSPSALYTCGIGNRKKMGLKAVEAKWMSIKRWSTITTLGINLPEGVYFSIKRHEGFVHDPYPYFKKTEFVLLMFPYGNVWSQINVGMPITEEWMWAESGKKLMLERLVEKDAANPIKGYFEAVNEYYKENPDQVGIHLKRKRND